MGAFSCARYGCYHRSWNDIRWACTQSKGGLNHTVLQLSHAYNTNYGPDMQAALMASNRELLQDWRELAGEWEERSRGGRGS